MPLITAPHIRSVRFEEVPVKGVLIGHPNHAGLSRTVVCMDNRTEVREFLISRRAKLTPQQAGLPNVGNRRVPGLRRGEVAALAGVSIEYYSKVERGALAGVVGLTRRVTAG